MFSVFDFTFLYWIAFGVMTVPLVLWCKEWLADRGIDMTWWKWIILAGWYVAFLLSIAAPFVILGEGEPGAWWKLLLFNLAIDVVSCLVVYRILLLKLGRN